MKLSPQWLREFVDVKVSNAQLAEELTLTGTAVENTVAAGDGADYSMIFEMEITTNRPDDMNHYGVAREVSALYDVPLKPIAPKLPALSDKSAPSGVTIAIEDGTGCARYTGRVIRGVKIGPSPAAIAQKLNSLDHRAINNAADATNYTLWEVGHPTHAFDLDKLEGAKIIVRRARDGETLKTLDGVERKLTREDLVIADAVKPVALAGVMGGFDSMITEATTNVLIEAAWFEPVVVRKMAKRHGMHTDASHRFERGADFGATLLAADRVAELILASAGGKLVGAPIDTIAREMSRPPILLRCSEVKRILGKVLPNREFQRILGRLGFGLTANGDDYTVEIPSWRLDVEREIDLIEELARVHGYDKFENSLPPYVGAVVELADAEKDARLRCRLLALGYNEAISLTFISSADAVGFSPAIPLALENPMSDEARMMRSSLLPGMLDMLAYNLNRGVQSVRLFEAGHVFKEAGGMVRETKRIALGAAGEALAGGVHQAAKAYSFFDVKGDVEALLAPFAANSLYYDSHTAAHYHPGRSARAVLNGATVAQFGQVHPEMAAARKIKQDVFVAEIFLDRLYQQNLRSVKYVALPKYPAVERDFSLLFPNTDATCFEPVHAAIVRLGIAELRQLEPVEVLAGGTVASVPQGSKSVLLRATFQSAERTLREEEVAQWAQAIVGAMAKLGGVLRS